MISTLAGATNRLDTIRGRSTYNVEDHGIALTQAHGAGADLSSSSKQIAAADALPTVEAGAS